MSLVIILSDSESENEIAPNPPVVSSSSDSSEPEEFVPETEDEPKIVLFTPPPRTRTHSRNH